MPDVSFSAIDASSTIRNFSAFDPGDEVLVPYRRTSPDQQAELVNGLNAITTAIGSIGGANAVATAAAPSYAEDAQVNLSVNLGGDLRVISKPNPGSSWPVTGAFFPATQPVSGTFWQATQPVSIAGSVAVTGTFFQATQPISAASLPLPALAATSTLQGAQGTGSQYNPPAGGSGIIGFLSGLWMKANDGTPTIVSVRPSKYEALLANTPTQTLGTTGAVGDQLEGLWVVPTATTIGAISVKDGSNVIPVYAGGTVGADLKGFFIPWLGGAATTSAGWQVSVGVGATPVAFGQFT